MESIHAFSKNLNEGSTGFHIKIFKENHVLGLFSREKRSLYWTSSTSLLVFMLLIELLKPNISTFALLKIVP